MLKLNPLLAIDFYKVDHRRQYPEGTTEIYSNFTPRYYKESHSLSPNFDEKVVVFGIQGFIKSYLIHHWNQYFFHKPLEKVIVEYRDIVKSALGLLYFDTSHLEALHDLGYLPIEIKAIPEGYRVPIGIPVLTIVNTLPEFFWLTNYLETSLSAGLWKAMTSATTAFEFKKLLTRFAARTSSGREHLAFQAHDFSFRGMSGIDDATVSGAAHLTSFMGTDCVPAISYLQKFYGATGLVGASVPATEHSVMTCCGADGEEDIIRRLITETYPDGIVSIVCDSYNFWETVDVKIRGMRDEIMARNGCVVIRPDSGNPVDIICGDSSAEAGTPAARGAIQLLWDIFGGTVNSKGYKQLDPHVGLIYGDAITHNRAELILELLEEQGFSSSNIVFGVGSYTYQYVTRDSLGFAMKATSCVVNGERRAIYKDPVTASGKQTKKSARGLLCVTEEEGVIKLLDDVSPYIEKTGLLQTVFRNGIMINEVTLKEIRDRLDGEL